MQKKHWIMLAVLVAACLLAAFCPESLYARAENESVWTTPTGERYHRQDCESIHDSTKKTTISAAEASGYEPCGNCHPEIYLLPHYVKQVAFGVLGIALLLAMPLYTVILGYVLTPIWWVWEKVAAWWKTRKGT